MESQQYLAIQPIPLSVNHVGLKITSRSFNPNYTCEYPQRKEVARQNYNRRKYQFTQCGYYSPSSKPYNELGCVVLDSKQLVLQTLGQKEEEKIAEVFLSYNCLYFVLVCEMFH